VVIPLLFFAALFSLMGSGPFRAAETQKWFSAKILIYSLLLVIGLKLRFIMRDWTILFRKLEAEGPNTEIENQLDRSLKVGRGLAYIYWIGIATVAFLGATKPF
jgi:hypothetical protein